MRCLDGKHACCLISFDALVANVGGVEPGPAVVRRRVDHGRHQDQQATRHPLGLWHSLSVEGEMTETTTNWLTEAALAVAKRQSDDVRDRHRQRT